MNHKFRMISLILVAFLAILPYSPAAPRIVATSPLPGQFIFGQS